MDLLSKKVSSQLLLHWHLRDLHSGRVRSLQLSGSGFIGPFSWSCFRWLGNIYDELIAVVFTKGSSLVSSLTEATIYGPVCGFFLVFSTIGDTKHSRILVLFQVASVNLAWIPADNDAAVVSVPSQHVYSPLWCVCATHWGIALRNSVLTNLWLLPSSLWSHLSLQGHCRIM